MLRRLAVLVLFSLAGSVAGVEASWHGLHYPDCSVGLAGTATASIRGSCWLLVAMRVIRLP
jgi:hypothetical protein